MKAARWEVILWMVLGASQLLLFLVRGIDGDWNWTGFCYGVAMLYIASLLIGIRSMQRELAASRKARWWA